MITMAKIPDESSRYGKIALSTLIEAYLEQQGKELSDEEYVYWNQAVIETEKGQHILESQQMGFEIEFSIELNVK